MDKTIIMLAVFSGITVILVAFVAYLVTKINKLQTRIDHLLNNTTEKTIEDSIYKTFEKLENLKNTIIRNDEEIKSIVSDSRNFFTKYSFTTYNAYDDAGGMVSFVLCLLSNENNGFIINSMHSRTGTRVYAKEVKKGEYSGNLSDEESQGLAKAISFM